MSTIALDRNYVLREMTEVEAVLEESARFATRLARVADRAEDGIAITQTEMNELKQEAAEIVVHLIPFRGKYEEAESVYTALIRCVVKLTLAQTFGCNSKPKQP